MAKVEGLIPHIIEFEAGQIKGIGESLEEYFYRSLDTGLADDVDDLGGLTLVGVTWNTYRSYIGSKATKEEFLKMDYKLWYDILKKMYWDRWKADKLINQSVANILVDWVWASGVHGIKIPQRILGVKSDGIVGKETLNRVNSVNQKALFEAIVVERRLFIDSIVRSRPQNAKFRNGWLRRINAFDFIA